MLVVKIELWPFGNEANKLQLAEVKIINDGTGNKLVGNYKYEIDEKGFSSKGRLYGFIREHGPLALLYEVLHSCFERRKSFEGKVSEK